MTHSRKIGPKNHAADILDTYAMHAVYTELSIIRIICKPTKSRETTLSIDKL